MKVAFITTLLLLGAAGPAGAGDYPRPAEATAVLKDFRFASGESLPAVRLHYRTLGRPERDPQGKVRNAVLILHATGGRGGNFLGDGAPADWFAGQLFGKGQPLDAGRYFLIIPDNLGHGKSSKPSDGLRARFPRYGYHDLIAAQHRLVTEVLGVDDRRLALGTSRR